jgi:hypothetical protein
MNKNMHTGAAKERNAAKYPVSLCEKYGAIFDEIIQKVPRNMARRFIRLKRKELDEAGLTVPDNF